MALPLGMLGYAVLEQHGEAARDAVTRVLARMRATLPPDGRRCLVGRVYDEREVVREPLQAANWVTLGEIVCAGMTTFVDVNVRTGATRERCVGFALAWPAPAVRRLPAA